MACALNVNLVVFVRHGLWTYFGRKILLKRKKVAVRNRAGYGQALVRYALVSNVCVHFIWRTHSRIFFVLPEAFQKYNPQVDFGHYVPATAMKVASANNVKVYTVSGQAVRALPEWLVRQKKRSLRDDPGTRPVSVQS